MPRRRHALPIFVGTLVTLFAVAALTLGQAAQTPADKPGSNGHSSWLAPYRSPAQRILREAQADDFAWTRLAELTDTFGHRFSGSPALEDALRWIADEMRKDGLDSVRLEPVMVPRWVRGTESAEIVAPGRHTIAMLGLGGSVGTPPEGVEAEVLVVRSFEALDANSRAARGKIVVFNAPYTSYNDTVPYRTSGPARAAQYGAVAALIRSIGPTGHRTPHTGSTSYANAPRRIPAAAISAEDAERLQRLHDRRVPVVVRLTMSARDEPDALSANVIGEVAGSDKPEEVVVIAGHIDSWDVGTGAVDDAAGCVAVWEAVRLLKKLGLKPRRTIRVVLFTNEENGLRGAYAYREKYMLELKNHVMMLETDTGLFPPIGFGFSGSPKARARITEISELVREVGANRVAAVGGGADIGPSVQAGNIPSMSLDGDDSRFFFLHHTAADTVDKVAPKDIARAAASIAVMAYVVDDMPSRLDQE
ncbi:MAG: M20/M25/M40 family metallo-hydrolase [Vicinamibacterales bacterium]